MAEGGGHGVPAESVEVDADAVVGGFFDAGDHVGVAGDQDEVAELATRSVDHQVCDESGVDAFLCASFTPFDELPGAELDPVAGAQGALVAVGSGVGDAVVPHLTVDGLVELVADHDSEVGDYLG